MPKNPLKLLTKVGGKKGNIEEQSQMDDFDPYTTNKEGEVREYINRELDLIRQELQPNISKQLNNTTNSTSGKPEVNAVDVNNVDDNYNGFSASSTTTTRSGSVLTNRSKSAGGGQQENETSKGIAIVTPPTVPKRIKTTSVRERKKIGKHLSFRERPDFLKSRYFYFTFLYGLFYLIGAIVGYQRKKNLFCLLISGFLGLLCLAFSILHGIDYYSGAPLESVYVSLPFIISLFFCILMACFYAIGSVFKTSLMISIVCGVATVFYGYALVKDYSDGSYYKENIYVQPKETEDMQALLKEFDENNRSEGASSATVDEVQPVDYKPTTIRKKATASVLAALSSNNGNTSSSATKTNSIDSKNATKFFNATNRNTMTSRSHTHSSRYEALMKKGIKIKDSTIDDPVKVTN